MKIALEIEQPHDFMQATIVDLRQKLLAEPHIGLDRQILKQPRCLERTGDAKLGPSVRSELVDRSAHQLDAASVSLHMARQDIDQRRLAGAVGPDQAVNRACGDLEGNVT